MFLTATMSPWKFRSMFFSVQTAGSGDETIVPARQSTTCSLSTVEKRRRFPSGKSYSCTASLVKKLSDLFAGSRIPDAQRPAVPVPIRLRLATGDGEQTLAVGRNANWGMPAADRASWSGRPASPGDDDDRREDGELRELPADDSGGRSKSHRGDPHEADAGAETRGRHQLDVDRVVPPAVAAAERASPAAAPAAQQIAMKPIIPPRLCRDRTFQTVIASFDQIATALALAVLGDERHIDATWCLLRKSLLAGRHVGDADARSGVVRGIGGRFQSDHRRAARLEKSTPLLQIWPLSRTPTNRRSGVWKEFVVPWPTGQSIFKTIVPVEESNDAGCRRACRRRPRESCRQG